MPGKQKCLTPSHGSRPTLHLVYSTNWVFAEGQMVDRSKLSEEMKRLFKFADGRPHCCELTNTNFQKLLAKEGRLQGLNVVRWPINGRDSWLAVGEAARSGRMVPGAAAVLLHSWTGDYEKECVPAWDYYPVLEALKVRHLLLYPSAPLDRLHSEKRYKSALMPPTRFLKLSRSGDSWFAESGGDVKDVATKMVHDVTSLGQAAGLTANDVMVKSGLSWGGQDVVRLKPSDVPRHIVNKILPKLPQEAKSFTVLLQAKVDVVAELRWVVLDGKLRGRGWRTFHKAKLGKPVISGGMDCDAESIEALIQAGLAKDYDELQRLEEGMSGHVTRVLAEATADASGQVPQFLRVDLLIDARGRAWLGERESWGADLIKRTYNPKTQKFTCCDPKKTEVASAMVARAVRCLRANKQKRVALQGHPMKQKVASAATVARTVSRPQRDRVWKTKHKGHLFVQSKKSSGAANIAASVKKRKGPVTLQERPMKKKAVQS